MASHTPLSRTEPGGFHLHREGSGPPLLLLPGLGSGWFEYRMILPGLAARYDVLAADLPGQGQSPALPGGVRPDVSALTDAVEQALDRAGVAAPHVLGTSLGGRVALELARRQRARSVVAIGATGPVLLPGRAYQVGLLAGARLGFKALAPVAPVVLRVAPLRAVALAPLRARGWRTPPDEAVAVVRSFATGADFWRQLRHAVLPEATLDYSTVRCPVLLAQSSHDVLSLGQVLRLAGVVPDAKLRVLPLAGHSPAADVPERVIALVDEAAAAAGEACS